jgi:thiamine kinase-like enzyme
MDVEEIVERLWPGSTADIEVLGGGITNRNFKVAVEGESFVLRVGGKDTALLGIDRSDEHEASLVAAALGIAPEVVRFQDGCLVTRYVEGETGRADPADVGRLLRRLHDGPSIPGRFDAFRVVEVYAEIAVDRGIRIPDQYEEARALAAEIERLRVGALLVPCHNDLLAANFIHDGDRLWLVDWEYAGMGDPFFDLANFAVNNGLDGGGEAVLLDAYGTADPRALTLMRFMSDFREAMWGVVQQALSELDFDFAGYAARHFERLGRTAAEPGFRSYVTQTQLSQ